MMTNTNELAAYFYSLTDEELIRQCAGDTLSDSARSLAEAEASSRGLTAETAGNFSLNNAPEVSEHPGMQAPAQRNFTSANYFIRHWRGELSLPVSYWVNGSLLFGGSSILLGKLVNNAEELFSLRQVAALSIAYLIFTVASWFWSAVGIWRSASRHKYRGGASGWAVIAQIMVVLGAVAMVARLTTTTVPQLTEFTRIVTGNDPIKKANIKVVSNGQTIILNGTLGEGSADEVQRVLDTTANATTLVLASNGGRLLEAQRIASIVRERRLNTYTETICASACTYIFLAGKDRAATPNAKIGFHQPTFVGVDPQAMKDVSQKMAMIYREAGLPDAFIKRGMATVSDDMWFPTREELIKANVLTRVSLGGETSARWSHLNSKSEILLALRSLPLFEEYENRFPGMLEEISSRAWEVKKRGGTDAEIQNAIRGVVSAAIPKIIKTSDDQILEHFARILLRELSAARALSAEACVLLLEGKLDISSTLPKEIAEEEKLFMQNALKSLPRRVSSKASPSQRSEAMMAAIKPIPQQLVQVISNQSAYANQPSLLCDSMIGLYKSVLSLPDQQRKIALQTILQSE
jgi:ATP-dependent protease ClpP protease subunit